MLERYDVAEQFIDVSLEEAFLATLAAQPGLYWDIADLLAPEVFTEERQAVYESIIRAIEDGRDPEPIESSAKVQDPVEAAERLTALYEQRQVAALSFGVLARLREGSDVQELIAQLEAELSKIQQNIRELQAGQVIPFTDLLPEVIKDAAQRRQAVKEKGTSAIGVPTGIRALDKMLGGLQTGIHLVAAKPGEGKTTFMLQIAANAAESGFPVIFVSFEETLPRLTLKVICSKAELEAKKYADGYGDIEALQNAIKEFGPELGTLYFMEGTSKLTVSQLKAKALQVMNKAKTDKCLIVVDYLQRWATGRRESDEFRLKVSALVSELRELSLRLDSPIIVISSQNRDGQGTPGLTSFKESGDVEYSADTAMFLVQDEARQRQMVKPVRAINLVVAKNRYGDIGNVNLIFRPDTGRFWEAEK